MEHCERAAHTRAVQADLPSRVRRGGHQPQYDIAEQERAQRRRRAGGPQKDKSSQTARGAHQERHQPAGPFRDIEPIHLLARHKNTHIQHRQTGHKQQSDTQPPNAMNRRRSDPGNQQDRHTARRKRGAEQRRYCSRNSTLCAERVHRTSVVNLDIRRTPFRMPENTAAIYGLNVRNPVFSHRTGSRYCGLTQPVVYSILLWTTLPTWGVGFFVFAINSAHQNAELRDGL